MSDNVNHPAHYEQSTSIECIEAMELMFDKTAAYDFCVCNVLKYIWRHKFKNGLEDLNKAQWYLNKACELNDGEISLTLESLQHLLNEKTAQWVESH